MTPSASEKSCVSSYMIYLVRPFTDREIKCPSNVIVQSASGIKELGVPPEIFEPQSMPENIWQRQRLQAIT